jgi:uncharacterized protein (DUF1330 family)
MPAYVIAETDINNPEQYERYRAVVPATLETYGGRFLVRGGEHIVLEGEWQPTRLVVIEFDDLDAVRRWWDSPEYQEAKQVREGAATMRVVAVQGV